MKKIIFVLIVLMVFVFGCTSEEVTDNNTIIDESQINSFEDCAKYYPIMESFPRQCNTPSGLIL